MQANGSYTLHHDCSRVHDKHQQFSISLSGLFSSSFSWEYLDRALEPISFTLKKDFRSFRTRSLLKALQTKQFHPLTIDHFSTLPFRLFWLAMNINHRKEKKNFNDMSCAMSTRGPLSLHCASSRKSNLTSSLAIIQISVRSTA